MQRKEVKSEQGLLYTWFDYAYFKLLNIIYQANN